MDPRFSLLTFPQRFDGARLHLRVLVIPRLSDTWNGDPLMPLIEGSPNPGDTTPAFADADLRLEARVLDGLTRFPVDSPVDLVAALPEASGPIGAARPLFEALVAPVPGRFRLSAAPPSLAEQPKDGISLSKHLPRSYRDSFLFTGPRHPNAFTDDSYECAINEATDPNPAFQSSPDTVSWGQIHAYCLRHRQLAQRLGLIRAATVAVGGLFENGGFLYVDLTDASDYAPQVASEPTLVARYAARIPRLEGGTARPLFAALQFPVLFDDPMVPGPPPAPGNYDAAFIEAADYDDGFAKIVHATQPVSQNLLAEDADGFPPLTDIGIRLGWDDEQVLIWQSRQLQPDPTVPPVGGDPRPLDAPLGAFAYRIDARKHGEIGWHTLVRVRSKAPLALDGIPLGDPPDAQFLGELGVEVHPQQFDGEQPARKFWLPAYLAQWNGTSLVIPDEHAAELFKTEEATGQAASLGRIYDPIGLDDIPLRYGETYELRVRLMDPTGGGPHDADEPVQEGPSPVASVHFVRHVVPERVRVTDVPTFPEQELDAFFTGKQLEIDRPRLGYPSVVFTGKYPHPIPLLQAASDAAVGKGSFGIPDPDVRRAQIDVEVRALRMDNLLSLSGREAYAHLYTTTREFPAGVNETLTVPLEFQDAHVLRFGDPTDLGDLGLTQSQIDALAELPLPTARDIRLTIRALADDDAAYFAPGAHVGKPIQLRVRRQSHDETKLFAKTTASMTIRGVYLQPDPAPLFDGTQGSLLFQGMTGESPSIVQRLADQIGVDQKGLTLVGKRGERVVFGCARGIRHTLAPDNSSLTFAAKDDLVNQWIVALTFQLDRDWTWDDLQPLSFEVFRGKKFKSDPDVDDNGGKPIGDWEIIPTASLVALDRPDRDHTTLVFLDAVEPKSAKPRPGHPGETAFPDLIELEYRIEPRFLDVPTQVDQLAPLALELPVTTPPAQIPRIVSAGIALSRYTRNATYSATEARRRFLWLELEQPPADPNDAYFVRLLAYAPDPLLSDDRLETFVPPEESPLAIDPELVRTIAPGASDDAAGLGAMTQLQPSDHSDRHFLIPLPPGLSADSPELFGFFTYELRVGHANIWSTAQGRFGRQLRSTGVQHPAPTIFCTCYRNQEELTVGAPFAKAVLHGKNITADPPRTELWALLYAQVRQADGQDWRNVLLDDRQLLLVPKPSGLVTDIAEWTTATGALQNRDAPAMGATLWRSGEIDAFLRSLGLPIDAPISVLCVEMMPTLEALHGRRSATFDLAVTEMDLASAVFTERAGRGAAGSTTAVAEHPRPLSDALGHYRILRTSPLTPAPGVC
jgi:hypothetical protein